MSRIFASLALICVLRMLSPVPAGAAIIIDTVPVGNLGNANDPSDGDPGRSGVQNYGGVSYAYYIGKYEVTIGQYAEFLNAVAATDTYGLYDPLMATNLNVAGIQRNGSSPPYTYSVLGSPKRPITYVSWGDAARFANWLDNGQPTGSQGPGTTEDGAYSLNGRTDIVALRAAVRNPNAKWFIPTENEWYKAAYHQPAAQGGDSDDYWFYPMKTNSDPYSDQPPGATPDNTRVANFYQNDGVLFNGYNDGYAVSGSTASPHLNALTDVGAYSSSPSFYGTFDQGGNVYEWTEALVTGSRRTRGGSWIDDQPYFLSAWSRFDESPTNGNTFYGFRMATIVPEPTSLALAALGTLGGLLTMRRRRV